jgi:hypothetical protein
VDDSGGEPPPIIYYISVAYVMRGGYFLFFKTFGIFLFFQDYTCNKILINKFIYE